MESKQIKKRIWELDFFRGVALIFMVYFHLIFDLNEFYGVPVNYTSGFNFLTGRMAVILFIFIAGISSTLTRSNFRRGLKLLALSLVISVFSYLYNPDFIIKFGIIHFFACSILLYPLIKKISTLILGISGFAIIFLGFITSKITTTNELLFPFGVTTANFQSSDYYSLIPWIGLYFFGIVVSRLLYKSKKSLIKQPLKENIVNFVGKHSLIIYVIHQPIIIGILYLIFK